MKRTFSRTVLGAACLVAMVADFAFAQNDPIILYSPDQRVMAGRYSIFAEFQRNLRDILSSCAQTDLAHGAALLEPTGQIDGATRKAIQDALACGKLESVPDRSPAHQGAITRAVWRAVMGENRDPTLRDRVMAIVLTFEATDFGEPPEWNFCQDNEVKSGQSLNPRAPDFVCLNKSDPCSFLTWGPRGATAGDGRELPLILSMIAREHDDLLRRSFGSEYRALKRFMGLKSSNDEECRDDSPMELFLCAVWMDPARRERWNNALMLLGREPAARAAYDRLYTLGEFDGGTLAGYVDLWRTLGLTVNEVDYAFFVDRATHFGGPWSNGSSIIGELRACMAGEHLAHTRNGMARRCLGRLQPHKEQAADRLGRDVAFYLDAYPDGALSETEMQAWSHFVPISAVTSFGLQETVAADLPPAPSLGSLGARLKPRLGLDALTRAERKACPQSVLSPVRRIAR